jgi:serine/threonine protein kinase
VIGITAARTKQNHRKLALVAIAADATLEQWIPQVDQWTFQKTFRTALAVASAVRDFHQKDKIHPNLQPRNIFITQNEPMVSLVDDWPTLPLSSRYGRYPYVAPEICHDSASVSQASNVYSLGVILWQLASGVIFPSFAPLCKDVYAFTFPNHIDSAYVAVIKRCLARSPANRPTADQVCEALVRTLMADMACPASRQWIQLHALEIRDRQSQLAKYLAMHHAKRDLHDLMRGASISKRMMLQVQASFERHWHNKATSSQTVHPAPPPPSRRISVSETQRKKKRHIYKTNKNDCCNNIYGAELPDLMQMGFA